jgi:hypothetical protein
MMAYDIEQREELFKTIFELIENGNSLRKALIEVKLSSKTFYEWLDLEENKDKVKQYARATELRAEALLDEAFDIVDSTEADVYKDDDGNVKIDGNTVQRARLQYDARKWLVSKLNPKKYGDRTIHSGDEDMPIAIVWNEEKSYE